MNRQSIREDIKKIIQPPERGRVRIFYKDSTGKEILYKSTNSTTGTDLKLEAPNKAEAELIFNALMDLIK